MSAKAISIIGCGWLGLPLAQRLLTEGYVLKGSTTSTEKVLTLNQIGIEGYTLQLVPNPVGNFEALLQADTLIIDISPKAGKMGDDFHPKQIEYLTAALKQSTVRHVIYVSSTSVYPELNRVVVENDVINAEQSAAPSLAKAEQLVQTLSDEKAVTILRYGGLMGYDRIPGKYVAGKIIDSGNVPVNYIHRDDAVAVLVALIKQGIAGTYNAVAPEHPTREAVYRKSCADFGYDLPAFTKSETSVAYKIVSPAKLIEATNYAFKYANPLQFYYELGAK